MTTCNIYFSTFTFGLPSRLWPDKARASSTQKISCPLRSCTPSLGWHSDLSADCDTWSELNLPPSCFHLRPQCLVQQSANSPRNPNWCNSESQRLTNRMHYIRMQMKLEMVEGAHFHFADNFAPYFLLIFSPLLVFLCIFGISYTYLTTEVRTSILYFRRQRGFGAANHRRTKRQGFGGESLILYKRI